MRMDFRCILYLSAHLLVSTTEEKTLGKDFLDVFFGEGSFG